MAKKFRSISWKIWYSLIGTIFILFILVLIAYFTVFSHIRNEFIYDQLEESSKVKKTMESSREKNSPTNESFWVAHFGIEIVDNKPEFRIDQYTRRIYQDKNKRFPVLEVVADKVFSNKNSNEGYLKDEGTTHYYYVDWDENKKGAIIFITSINSSRKIMNEITLMTLALLIISYFTSRHLAKKLAKPIQELELFAEEIAKKNWTAEAPDTDNNEIGLLADALQNMKESLKELEEREHHFLQSTSHDLKTPVMIIQGYAQAIIDGIKIESELSAAQIIKSESDRLERKINQLLKLNTIGNTLEGGKKEIIRIDKVINNLVKKFRVLKPELKWNLILTEYEIEGDLESLLIAFENIIENQLRYANRNVNINIIVGEECIIRISNDGPGFEIADPDTLFNIYQKDRQGNFGLGLAIVKQIINYHDGNIEAFNRKTGVEFIIHFFN